MQTIKKYRSKHAPELILTASTTPGGWHTSLTAYNHPPLYENTFIGHSLREAILYTVRDIALVHGRQLVLTPIN